jgi:hypothetical protein
MRALRGAVHAGIQHIVTIARRHPKLAQCRLRGAPRTPPQALPASVRVRSARSRRSTRAHGSRPHPHPSASSILRRANCARSVRQTRRNSSAMVQPAIPKRDQGGNFRNATQRRGHRRAPMRKSGGMASLSRAPALWIIRGHIDKMRS